MARADRPVSAVLHDIVGNVQDIVHAELRLAKSELSEELGKSAAAAICVGLAVNRFKSIRALPKTAANLKEDVA